ncbi:MAG TPA: glycoside hydrolase family 32 protein [Actinotalea sp.]|nr:glycoside hydrolase family 32 protein [Actinotalea sp.]
MIDDPTRPRLHLTVRSGWINDPHGLTFHDGLYHVFAQHVPGVPPRWAPGISWAHLTSPDLLAWTELPVALVPGDGDGGVWSGSVVAPEGEPATLFYTSVDLDALDVGVARVARPSDGSWTSWTKGETVAALPADVPATTYRDPCLVRDGDAWWMLLGAGLADGTATAVVHRSDDLRTWKYHGLLATRHTSVTEPLWTGEAWECPQLFPLGDRWVLVVSVWDREHGPRDEVYAVGTFMDGAFTAQSWGRWAYGPCYYAGSGFVDRDGRRGMVHWMRDVVDPAGEWAGAISLPHLLRLEGDRVVAEPHPDLAARRGAAVVVGAGAGLAPGGAEGTGGGTEPVRIGAVCDIDWTMADASTAAELLVTDPDGAEVLRLTVADGTLTATVVDVAVVAGAAASTAGAAPGTWTMPLLDGRLRVVLDGPVCEVFTSVGVLGVPVRATSSDVLLTATGDATAVAHPLT